MTYETVRPTPPQFTCFICEAAFPAGFGDWGGRGIEAWDIRICDGCYSLKHDGLDIRRLPHLRKHLEGRRIEIVVNSRGFLPIPE